MNESASESAFVQHRPERYAFILNPRGGNGKAAKQWEKLEPDIAREVGDFALFRTKHAGHATELTRQALREGYDRIVSCGGDGTNFEIVNGFFDDETPINPEASLALLPMGTGSDLCKTFRIPKGAGAIPFLSSDEVLPIDIGKVSSMYPGGEEKSVYFFTAVHIGMGAVVNEHVNRRSKALGGFVSFLLGLLSARAAYKPTEMTVEAGGGSLTETFIEVIVANGQYDGGGMQVAPHTKLNDGLFEIYTIGDMGAWDSLMNIPRLYRGTQDSHHAVKYLQADRIVVTSKERLLASPDGEIVGALPATIEIVPKALRVVTGPNPPIE